MDSTADRIRGEVRTDARATERDGSDAPTRSGTRAPAEDHSVTGATVVTEHLQKRFGVVRALDDVSVTIQAGSVHAFVGENGAGKSTLGKIIGGVHQPDGGLLMVDGLRRRYRSPSDARDDGLTMVAQEVVVIPGRSVLENVFLGRLPHRMGLVDRRALRGRYDELVERAGFALPPDANVGDLRLADQQKVEILRGLARNARLIVLDEPTAALAPAETSQLFRIVRNLQQQGTTIVYVSHFLKEVLDLADTVTVLRDGGLVETTPVAEETEHSLIRKMIGRSLDQAFPPRVPVRPDAREALRVEDLSAGAFIDGASFSIKEGEILGFAGLVGSGRSEVAHALFGALPRTSGEIRINGKRVSPRSPRAAQRAGIALLPESRKEQGLVLGRSIAENITLPHPGSISRFGVVSRRRERRSVDAIMRTLDVRAPGASTPVLNLSGGNQQKVLFAKSLLQTPTVLIADEPTRGVDVGAKRAIYDLITSLAADGMAIMLISSELEEVLALSHRICVMKEGRIVTTMNKEDISQRSVMAAAFGSSDEPSER